MFKRSLLFSIASVVLSLHAPATGGQREKAGAPHQKKQVLEMPFNFALEVTDLETAWHTWAAKGVNITSAGHMIADANALADNSVWTVANENVKLVDVSGASYEGLDKIRFGFFNDRLFLIQAECLPAANDKLPSSNFKEVKRALTLKYGSPSMKAKGFLDEYLEWRMPPATIMLTSPPIGNCTFVAVDNELNREVKSQNRKLVEERKEALKSWGIKVR